MDHIITSPEILSKQLLGEFSNTKIWKIEILAPIISNHFKPGQFIILMVEEKGERIPLTIAETNLEKGSITLIFQEVGYTTKLLGNLKVGDKLAHIVGPLGKPTEIEYYGTVVLIGGGVGTAEIYPIVKALKEKNNKIITIIGARNKNLVILEEEFKKISDELYITTDDGSYGQKGFVSDVLKSLIENNVSINLVYVVGPVPMMKVVSQITKPHNIKTLVSLNTIMVDGTGMCGSCRITHKNKIKYVCCDGPEFDAHEVDWEEIINRNKTYIVQEQQIMQKINT